MSYESLLQSFQKICVLVTFAYLLSRTELFRRLFEPRYRSHDKLRIFLFFSLVALVELGLSPQQTPGSSRAVAATVAGLLGGPLVGAGVGLLLGLSSALILGMQTAHDALATMAGGLLGGWVSQFRPQLQLKVVAGLVVGALSHAVWLGLVLTHDNLVGTWDAIALLYGPPILLNGGAAALFLMIIGEMRAHQERIERTELARALNVANRVLPRLKYGINPQSAGYIADIIRRMVGTDVVRITDSSTVLASVGEETAGVPISDLSGRAMETGTVAFSDECEHDAVLGAGCAAPLFYEDCVVGCVEIYQRDEKRIGSEVAELGQEIAQFLSNYQIQLADLERRSEIASKAELRALQAQVHPHFLFNALNTIAALCEIDPSRAAGVAVQLGAYYRTALRKDGNVLIPLREEMANVRYYLDIEKARFGDRLSVVESMDDTLSDILVPALSLQPIVENAVLHGLSTKPGRGSLRIVTRLRGDMLKCWVVDDGSGMSREKLRGLMNGNREPHGLTILKNRLDKIYQGRFDLCLRSREGVGTAVLLSVPVRIGSEQQTCE